MRAFGGLQEAQSIHILAHRGVISNLRVHYLTANEEDSKELRALDSCLKDILTNSS